MLTSKYTREKARQAMPESWAFLLDELLHYQSDEGDAVNEQEGLFRGGNDHFCGTVSGNYGGIYRIISWCRKHGVLL
jgi:hypothetical protein